jgi:hypothetical protein
MNMTRMTGIAIGLTVVSAGALRAQTQETKTTTKTKVEMKGGKNGTCKRDGSVVGVRCSADRNSRNRVLYDRRSAAFRVCSGADRCDPLPSRATTR